MLDFVLASILMCGVLSSVSRAQEPAGREIQASSCFIRTYEEADIPALERGLITKILFKEGDLVEAGTVLTVLDDAEARIKVAMAKVDLELARKQLEEPFTVRIATAKLVETEQLIEKSKVQQQIALQSSISNVAVRQAKNALSTTQEDMNRALAARKEFQGSVSDAELSRLTYLRDRSQLEIESAEEQQAIARLEVKVEQAAVASAEALLERLKFELSQATTGFAIEKIEFERLKLQLELAETQLLRRRVAAPFSGMIVEQFRHRGEWMEPGQPIFRIVRLDQLIVEGYANSNQVHHTLRGAKVRVVSVTGTEPLTLNGKLTFISPEIDPVNQQVQIRALVDNSGGMLRSGQQVEMMIALP